jgi:hypothetical protein
MAVWTFPKLKTASKTSTCFTRPSGVARPSSPCWRRSGARVVAAPRLPGFEKEMLDDPLERLSYGDFDPIEPAKQGKTR